MTVCVDVLQEAIAATHLKHLDISGCSFANDGSLERILLACTKKKCMRVTACDFISHYSALSTLLQDPTNILENVELLGRGHIDDNDNHEKLKRLYF